MDANECGQTNARLQNLVKEIWAGFPASVTIVTAADRHGTPHGLTCTSICPVSTASPLLIAVLHHRSRTLAAIRDSQSFMVNFLRAGQGTISQRFASNDPTKFDGLRWSPVPAVHGAPLLVGRIRAYAGCHLASTYQMPDHTILVGRVVAGDADESPPLTKCHRTSHGSRSDGPSSGLSAVEKQGLGTDA